MDRRSFLKFCFTGLAGSGAVGLLNSCSAKLYGKHNSKKPNVLLIMADDMGYSDAECYGGDVSTPNLSTLAGNGLRFTQHYSTGRCWPSRAFVLTGYYAQQIRRDSMEGIKRGNRPSWAPLLPEMLKPYGYKSYHSGKWHIDGTAEAAGFDRSWGSHREGCDWDRFFDSGFWQEDEFSAPIKQGEQYYSTVAIADHSIACLKLHKKNHPADPFFLYTAFYSPHFPLHAMQKDIDKYRDAYLEGWDVIRQRRLKRMKKMGLVNCSLSERETQIVPHWNLTPDQLNERIGEGEAGKAVAWDSHEEHASLSADGFTLYFDSDRQNGYGSSDIWVTTRPTRDAPWGMAVNMGPNVNSSMTDGQPWISIDDRELYFISSRSGGYGNVDIWVARRETKNAPWDEPVNLGPPINSQYKENTPCLSPDGLILFFGEHESGPFRPDGFGSSDLWMSTRPTLADPWGPPINLGPSINGTYTDDTPVLSYDGQTLYFSSKNRPENYSSFRDIWQAPIIPIVDLNADGIVDSADMCIVVDNWGTDNSLCDIGPTPFGDGVVDVEDLIVLAGHLFEEFPPVEPVE